MTTRKPPLLTAVSVYSEDMKKTYTLMTFEDRHLVIDSDGRVAIFYIKQNAVNAQEWLSDGTVKHAQIDWYE
jgi:hypothetical protein